MKYLIAVLFSVVFTALATPKAPALTKTVVLNAKASRVSRAIQPQPEQKAAPVHTPAIAVAPAPQSTVSYPVSCSAYEPIVAQYNWSVRVAMAIMQAESGCNPYAISNAAINYDGVPDYGLFQIHGQYILNPSANIATAFRKYLSQGWYAWSTYKNGAYIRYL